MTKIDIFSGFLGAGKTTLIKKLIKEAYAGEKVVLIENEFGEIGIDGGFLQDAGINITEMNSGCICCSLVGDFSKALQQVMEQYAPERIVIEPSGVGKLSDVIKAVKNAKIDGELNAFCTVVDAGKCKMYLRNFGEFFGDQVENASCIILSHTDKVSEEKLSTAVALLKEKNATATLVTAPWDSLDGKAILAAMERKDSLQAELDRLSAEVEHGHEHHEHHHDECDDPDCCCHHEHHHEHHHDECDDPDCCCHHEHHHEHHHDECDDPDCCCHHEHHHEHHEHNHEHHHGHHHADDVFTSWGKETTRKYTKDELCDILTEIQHEHEYGTILRAKGIVESENGWLHFDYVPGEMDVREGAAGVTGRLCVIGCQLNEREIEKLFKI
ncbi:MAG: cobalamin biosynthesis protein CobW [Clostridiales bacterium]|nr:cobalamin biosynthesis protein CobW [Clostridiales bacterium]